MKPTWRPFELGVIVLTLVWGGLYIEATRLEVGGERVFCLWDDAMISMQYAYNLSRGEGLVWMPGSEHVQGISNLGVTLVMALLHALPGGKPAISGWFQLLNLILLVLVIRSARQLTGSLFPESHWTAVGAMLATAVCAPLAVWSLQGSDAGFTSLWLLLCVLSLTRSGGEIPPRSIALLGAGLLIRPDGAVAYLLFLGFALLPETGRRARLIAGLSALAIVLGGWLLLGLLYYGDPLPNTYYLKATGSPRPLVLAAGLEQLVGSLPRMAPIYILAGVGLWRSRSHSPAWLCAALISWTLLYSVWIGGDWAHEYGNRFVAPVLPLLIILTAGGSLHVLGRMRPRHPAAWAPAAAGLTLLLVLVSNPLPALADWLRFSPTTRNHAIHTHHANLAGYLRLHPAPQTVLALHWAGVVGYFSERPAVDVLGKSDRHIARLQVPRFHPGHSKWDWEYVLDELRPDVFLLASRGLLHAPGFSDDFLLARARGFEFYIRRSAREKLRDSSAVLSRLSVTPAPEASLR
jgi:hypothetical protein